MVGAAIVVSVAVGGTAVLVVSTPALGAVGWLVDVVNEVLRVPEVELRPPPGDANDLVTSICVRGDRFVSLLEPDRMQNLVAD